ncbi:hypothetical protein O3P69_007823 [Scylla paramamosain]|uniref:Uncharacterized protein n=1 Tax=Scylla paramamosain TaxID=85552 RepID=A0AAW0SDK6_SCYPA
MMCGGVGGDGIGGANSVLIAAMITRCSARTFYCEYRRLSSPCWASHGSCVKHLSCALLGRHKHNTLNCTLFCAENSKVTRRLWSVGAVQGNAAPKLSEPRGSDVRQWFCSGSDSTVVVVVEVLEATEAVVVVVVTIVQVTQPRNQVEELYITGNGQGAGVVRKRTSGATNSSTSLTQPKLFQSLKPRLSRSAGSQRPQLPCLTESFRPGLPCWTVSFRARTFPPSGDIHQLTTFKCHQPAKNKIKWHLRGCDNAAVCSSRQLHA